MKLAVIGLWHLGTVTAAVMAESGASVLAIDDETIIAAIDRGDFPVEEPLLREVWTAQRAAGRLSTSFDLEGLRDVDVAWICYDTPLDDHDRPNVDFVVEAGARVVDALPDDATVIISSQLPVGTTKRLEEYAMQRGRTVGFVVIPENLRLGAAVTYLRSPDRFVVGARQERDRARVHALLEPLQAPIISMSVESAEMTKHALNAFLATSVVFANEIAAIAERVGADAREIEQGLKSDMRIGKRAYVRAGEAFAGGTLARDLGFLGSIGADHGVATDQLMATNRSNERHKRWLDERLEEALEGIARPVVALLGLTYKPDTDTLRSSTAVALAHRLHARDCEVRAYDPAIRENRPEIAGVLVRCSSVAEALAGADVAVIMTPWPEFRTIDAQVWRSMRRPRLIDAQRFLEESAGSVLASYIAFGRP